MRCAEIRLTQLSFAIVVAVRRVRPEPLDSGKLCRNGNQLLYSGGRGQASVPVFASAGSAGLERLLQIVPKSVM